MRIREIALHPFRNFEHLHLPLEADRILILGRNGHGKTNILEAISYLSIGKSIRGAKDYQAVPHEGQYFDLRARCNDGRRECRLRMFFSSKEGKKAFCDEIPLPRVSDILGIFKTVHFSPEDVSLVLRFPAQRRRILDILISQSSASYLRELQRYQRILTQRNHLLRASKKTGKALDDNALQAWDAQLAQVGAGVRAKRLEALSVLAEPFSDYYYRFAPGREQASVDYRGPRAVVEEELQEELLVELRQKRQQERQLGYTVGGPHRDDLVFLLNGQPADTFASEGQLKTMLISWKMAEVRLLEQRTARSPVLLLDDVFSELDAYRAGQLLEIMDEFEQVLLTTPQELEGPVRARFAEIQLPG